ncbi:hypothetical protein BT93_L1712 [Corymbia citriodora subsp. variegata]|uniref:Uncharacterized protein n=1 Tax=Corymbia citriodora subsp. variegata TaxID=360336 RepID=A0A8T0CM70_CORYI|nr:hypothetical protein BT93_L1712 [Corymbia citriodora subsp. variegata]
MSALRRTEQLPPQRKRKLDEFLESGESSVDHGQALEKNLHLNVKKLVTTLSCVTNFADIIGDSLDEQTVHNSRIASPGVSTSIEGHEEKQSTNSFAPSTVELVSPSVVIDSNSWSQQDVASRNQHPEDPIDEADGSDISDADEESNVTVRRRVFSLLFLDDEYPTRPVVPIGPAFQAEIPVWVGTCTKNNDNTSESAKYIGTRIWPVEDGINDTLLGSNGQGRNHLDRLNA